MGCGCGKRKPASPRSAGLADPGRDPRPHVWLVDFPNGASQEFGESWQANAASRIGNGTTPRKVYTDTREPDMSMHRRG